MGDVLQGRRVEDVEAVLAGPPGDYALTPARDAIHMRLPNTTFIRLPVQEGNDPGQRDGRPCWGFTEHEDGSLTTTPSINLHETPVNTPWHGYLDHGVMREC